MKETIKTAVVAILLILALWFVVGTRGNDTLDWSKMSVDVSKYEETFSYNIVSSDYNGQYEGASNIYALVGKNDDGTYRVYFIRVMGVIKTAILRIDDLKLSEDGVGIFNNTNGNQMKITFGKGYFSTENVHETVVDNGIKGRYSKTGDISKFDINELKTK